MMKSLHIENYALISQLDIRLNEGFSVITGETGAGKSIILGAIGLLKGQRADMRSIKEGARRCVVEAVFDVTDNDISDFFEANDLDFDGRECLVRRELTAAGKSRAFINDTPVSATLLKELGDRLLDVHSQHQNLLINNEGFQISVLDTIAADQVLLNAYRHKYAEWRHAEAELRQAEDDARRSHDDEDYWRFQHSQLEEARLDDPSEQEDLEREGEMLEHAGEIREALFTAHELLDGDEMDGKSCVLPLLRRTSAALDSAGDRLDEARQLSERIGSCLIELKDIVGELDGALDRVEDNPERLMAVQERLNTIYTLERKHHVDTVEALMAVRDDYATKLDRLDNSDERITALQGQVEQLRRESVGIADELSSERKKAANHIEQMMVESLRELGMPNVRFEILIRHEDGQLTELGADKVTFLFSANKNTPMQDVARVASGGEIARVMLSLKALMADAVMLPTIIFDEIDTGVSGAIAEKMGQIMSEMGHGVRQVISITHLPQIASKGRHHYRVYKDEKGDATETHIIELSDNERVVEIAHMLSGAEVSEAALKNARTLLGK